MAPWQYCFALSISNLWPPGNTALRCLFVIYKPPGNTVLSLFLAATNNDTSWHYIQLRRSINPPKFPGITCNIILQYGAGRFSNKMNFFPPFRVIFQFPFPFFSWILFTGSFYSVLVCFETAASRSWDQILNVSSLIKNFCVLNIIVVKNV